MSRLPSITRFATAASYTVTRTAEGTLSNGRYTPGAETSTSIVAVIQPVNGRDLQALPEAQHSEEIRVCYTATRLYTREPNQDPDIVTIDSEDWEVIRVERWEAWGVNHYRAFLARSETP